jgi:hypothetical protein
MINGFVDSIRRLSFYIKLNEEERETQMKRKKYILAALILLLLPIQVQAERTEFYTGVDIMFVIDNSLSMQTNDPERMVYEAVKYIATLSEGSQNRIGFVIYNCGIIVQQGLQRVHDASDIHEIMERLQQTPTIMGTDVGLAMRTAHELLIEDNYRPGYTAMIMLSDGDTELNVIGQVRTQEEIEEEWEEVLEAVTFPIFTIQYSELGEGLQDGYRFSGQKDDWGERTGGRNYNTTDLEELLDAITSIYSELSRLSAGLGRIRTEAVEAGEFRLSVEIPETAYEQVALMQITLIGNDVIRDLILPSNEGELSIRTVGNNSVIIITNPIESLYEIYYTTVTGEEVVITTLTRMETRPEEVEEVEEEPPFEPEPLLTTTEIMIIIGGIVGLGIIILVTYLIRNYLHRRTHRNFKGSLECYFMITPEGTGDIPIQSWSVSLLASKRKCNLYELLKSTPLAQKMPEAKKIYVKINPEKSILIDNQGGVTSIRDGKESVEKNISLRCGEGIYLIFQKGTIEVELRVRRGSL